MRRRDIEALIKANPVKGSPEEMRSAFGNLAPDDPGGGKEGNIGSVPVTVFGEGGKIVLFLHGGGYVFGSGRTHAAAAAKLAALSRCRVVVPEYRLAPEHGWPVQLDDACTVLDALDGPVVVVGDSAGGHLAINLALARPKRIERLGLISPNTDRSDQSRTRTANSSSDLMNSDSDDRDLAKLAFGDMDPNDAAASPLLADLQNLPPLWITATTTEVLLDDTLLFANAVARAGGEVTLVIEKGLFHMWTLWPDWSPARRTWERLAQAIRQ